MKVKMKLHQSFLILFSIGLLACSESDLNNRLLTKAAGKPGEIILVMDSLQWQGELGTVLRKTLNIEVPGLGRPEPLFYVHYVEPTLFNSVLNKTKNIILVATLDSKTKGGQVVKNFMTPNYIQDNPDKFIISQKDIYASGQEVLYLFSGTEQELVARINKNRALIRNFFNQKEKERLLASMFVAKEKTGISNRMLKEHGFMLRIPNGYRLEANEADFVWYRSPGAIDKNIFVYYTTYNSDKAFENKNIIALRNRITGQYIFEDPEDPQSFIIADTVNIPTVYRSVKFNKKYSKEIRGIWKANNLSMGGPFMAYIFVDETNDRLYYIEGFIVAPGKNKREPMRELEAILSTFKTASELKSQTTTS
jgi:hypothetical protein